MSVEGNERLVLAGLTRALLDGGARAVPLAAIFEGCGRAMPAPVILEVLERLCAAGLVCQESAAAVRALAAGGARPLPQPVPAEEYRITEAGFEAHREAADREARALAEALPARLAEAPLGARERAAWAELHDYLSWRPDRSVHLVNFGLGRKLAAEEMRRFQEAMLRLGLLERAQVETHYRLTEFGRRVPRLPGAMTRG